MLKKAERLWDAEPGTPDGDAVEVLVMLIEDYEARHSPIPAPNPFAAVLFVMEQMGLRGAIWSAPSAAGATCRTC